MQPNMQLLEKRSIEAALNKNWKEAAELNKQILEKLPNDKNAKIRLGRAYIKTERFTEAKKIFKEILEKDPINSIAKKNYKLAAEKNADKKSDTVTEDSTKVLIKEPGTTTQVELKASKSLLSKLEPGQKIKYRSYKNKLSFFLDKKEIGSVTDALATTVYNARKNDCEVNARVIKPNEEHVTLILKCKKPIFKSEKQTENPYLSKEAVEEEDTEPSSN